MNQDAQPFQGIDTIILKVSDINRSLQWYRDQLGFACTWHDPEMKLAVMDPGGSTSLTIWETGEPTNEGGNGKAFPIFRCEDAAKARALLIERGISTGELEVDENVCWFQFRDPDGNVLEACQVKTDLNLS